MCWLISHYSPSNATPSPSVLPKINSRIASQKLREFRTYVCVCVNNISVKSLFKNKIVVESLAQQCMFGDAEISLVWFYRRTFAVGLHYLSKYLPQESDEWSRPTCKEQLPMIACHMFTQLQSWYVSSWLLEVWRPTRLCTSKNTD